MRPRSAAKPATPASRTPVPSSDSDGSNVQRANRGLAVRLCVLVESGCNFKIVIKVFIPKRKYD